MVRLRRSSAMRKMCKLLQLVVETMAMPFNISWSISWGKKMGWDFSFNFPNWDIARGFWQLINDQFSLNLNILSISLETRHIHFFLCIVFSLLLPTSSNKSLMVVSPSSPGYARNLAPQWPLPGTHCHTHLHGRDVCQRCGARVRRFKSWQAVHGENTKNDGNMLEQLGWLINHQVWKWSCFQTNAQKMGLEDDVLIGHGHQFYFGLSRVDSRIQHRQIPT